MDLFKPLERIADFLIYGLAGLKAGSYFGETLHFFVYDVLKIGILLVLINYVMAIIRFYFPLEKMRNLLVQRRWFGLDYFFAALLGVITPFCSCSSIPFFIGFLSAGIPIGVTFTFLICSPLVNESSLYLFPALFGMKATLIYNAVGIGVAMVGGWLIGRLRVEKYVEKSLLNFKTRAQAESDRGGRLSFGEKAVHFWREGMEITRQIFPYMVLGVGIGACIHGFVPKDFVERYFAEKTWWSIPLVTLLGVPFYANSVSVIPVMEAVVHKGVPLGTALTFMTSIVTVSVPEALILKKAMKGPLLAIFFGITIVGVMIMGYILNAVM